MTTTKETQTIELIEAHQEVLQAFQEAAEHHHVQDNDHAFEQAMHQRAVFGQQALVNVRNQVVRNRSNYFDKVDLNTDEVLDSLKVDAQALREYAIEIRAAIAADRYGT